MARTAAGSLPGRTNRKFLIVALLFGALTAVLFYALTANHGSTTKTGSSSAVNVSVVVARVSIKQRTAITADMLTLKSIASDARVAGSYTNVSDIVGKVTKFPIEQNQQVTAGAIVDTTKPLGGQALAPVVPDGMRAVSISANQVLTAGGLLLPGDYVDIVWECCPHGLQWSANGKQQSTSSIIFTRPIVQNVQVAAVAQSIVPSGPVGTSSTPGAGTSNPVAADTPPQVPNATTITLLVTPEQAGSLIMAEGIGTLRATLRNPGDTNLIQAQSETQFVTPNLIPQSLMNMIASTYSTTQ